MKAPENIPGLLFEAMANICTGIKNLCALLYQQSIGFRGAIVRQQRAIDSFSH